jgi:polyphosphate kinase
MVNSSTKTQDNSSEVAQGKQAVATRGKVGQNEYAEELSRLQTELCHLQQWVKETGERIVIVFEGRDGAGKGGTIRAITTSVSPRVFRAVALPAPSNREKTQLYVQRYLQHFPAAGEVVIFDRSWYNRAGVEHVMGFCTDDEYHRFLELCPMFEKTIIDSGIRLLKYWLEVGNEEQKRRFQARIADPLQQWKLSAIDLPSRERWYDYSRARDKMLEHTDTEHAPWYIVDVNDKRRARLNVLSHILSQFPYERIKPVQITLPERDESSRYDDVATLSTRRWIPEKY